MYTLTKIYLDYITHYGNTKENPSYRWATVTIHGDKFQLSKWYKGCGFSPEVVWFNSFEDAKLAGESWTNEGK